MVLDGVLFGFERKCESFHIPCMFCIVSDFSIDTFASSRLSVVIELPGIFIAFEG